MEIRRNAADYEGGKINKIYLLLANISPANLSVLQRSKRVTVPKENVLINDQEKLHLSALMWIWQQGNPAKHVRKLKKNTALLFVENN